MCFAVHQLRPTSCGVIAAADNRWVKVRFPCGKVARNGWDSTRCLRSLCALLLKVRVEGGSPVVSRISASDFDFKFAMNPLDLPGRFNYLKA